VALAAGVLVLTSGCGGTLVDRAEIEAVGNGYSAPAATGNPVAASADGSTDTVPAAVAATAAGLATAAAPAVHASTTATSSAKPAAGSTGKTTAAQSAAAPAVGSAKAAVPIGDQPCKRQLAPIVIGQTLATSGLIGATIGNLRQGLALWAKDVNGRGGVQCHPVQVISLDDGSDSARVSSNWNTLIHDRGAIAMLAAGEPITSGALRVSAERDKVPVIGGDVVTLDWFESQYFFPQGAHPFTAYDGSTVDAAKAHPQAKNAAIIYCVEASICTQIKGNFPNSAKLAGLNVVGAKAVSLTQSDYTAECQTFKDAKADIVWLALDGSANTRFARSCASLNYYPQLATSAIGIPPAAAGDPSLQKDTVYLGSQNVPFSTTDTPGAAAFHLALARYAPGFQPDENTLAGWTSGKVFEAAMAKTATQAHAGNVTTAMVLDGLWQLKNEKLDGLAAGVTFTKGETARTPRCYYTLLLAAGGVTAPFGSKIKCLDH